MHALCTAGVSGVYMCASRIYYHYELVSLKKNNNNNKRVKKTNRRQSSLTIQLTLNLDFFLVGNFNTCLTVFFSNLEKCNSMVTVVLLRLYKMKVLLFNDNMYTRAFVLTIT